MGRSREGGDAREHVCSRCITTALLTCWSVIITARRYLINAIVSFKNSHSRRRLQARCFPTAFSRSLQFATGWKVDAAGIGRESHIEQHLSTLSLFRASGRSLRAARVSETSTRTSTPSRDTPPASASPKRDATAADITLTS